MPSVVLPRTHPSSWAKPSGSTTTTASRSCLPLGRGRSHCGARQVTRGTACKGQAPSIPPSEHLGSHFSFLALHKSNNPVAPETHAPLRLPQSALAATSKICMKAYLLRLIMMTLNHKGTCKTFIASVSCHLFRRYNKTRNKIAITQQVCPSMSSWVVLRWALVTPCSTCPEPTPRYSMRIR